MEKVCTEKVRLQEVQRNRGTDPNALVWCDPMDWYHRSLGGSK
ncbi:MAG TPA: hypothetical protein PLQ29_09885 [Spirochaetales bacterium]|nr:hypothetical protein [Spirochaetales bacterium]